MRQSVSVAEHARIHFVVNPQGRQGHEVTIETLGLNPQRAYKNPMLAPVLYALRTGKVARLREAASMQQYPSNRDKLEQVIILLKGTRIIRRTISTTPTPQGSRVTFSTRRTDGN